MTTKDATATALQATAFHEAGHAVVLLHFGLPFTEVTICPGAGSLGHITHPPPLGVEHQGARERRTIARRQILAAYAGLEAERLIAPDAPEACAEGDHDAAVELSRAHQVMPRGPVHVMDERHLKFLEGLRAESRRLVRRLCAPIERLAVALLAAETLDMTAAENAADLPI